MTVPPDEGPVVVMRMTKDGFVPGQDFKRAGDEVSVSLPVAKRLKAWGLADLVEAPNA